MELSRPETAVEAGKSALRSGWNYPWYDRATDDLHRMNVRAPRDWDWLDDWFDWLPDWDLGGLLTHLGWLAIAVILAVIAYALIRAYLERELGGLRQPVEDRPEPSTSSIDRIEALPFAIRNPRADFLAEARRYYQSGNFAEAIIYLFSYQLIELDKYHHLRLSTGKTNQQYLREVRRAPTPVRDTLANLLQRTILLFEETFFGHRVPTKSAFESCWNLIGEFQRLVAESPGAPRA